MRMWYKKLTVVIVLMALAMGASGLLAQSQSYIVGSGDTLDLIAAYFDADMTCIATASALTDWNLLEPGQRLVIPSGCPPYSGLATSGRIHGTVLLPSQPLPTITLTAAPTYPLWYTVQPGDQLGLVAQDLGADFACMIIINNLSSPDMLYVGQLLAYQPCTTGGTWTLPVTPVVPVPVLPTTTPIPTQISPPPVTQYTVRPGDRLTDVAQRFEVTIACLVRVNALPNQNIIRSGQVLEIGQCLGNDTVPTTQQYTVQRGDRLQNIAVTFGVELACLAERNQITQPNRIVPGTVLTIDYAVCNDNSAAPTPAAVG